MKKSSKKTIIVLVCVILLLVAGYYVFSLWWNGAFDSKIPKEIKTYESPDKAYTVTFYQLGDPEWPFGSTDVRLTLKDADGKELDSVDTEIHNDGKQTAENNLKEIKWFDDRVEVTLSAEEMDDMTVELKYKK